MATINSTNDKQQKRIIFVNDTKIENNEQYKKFISLSEQYPNVVFFADREIDEQDESTYFTSIRPSSNVNITEFNPNYINYSSKNIYIGGKSYVPVQGIASKKASVIINDYMFTLGLDPTYGLLNFSKEIAFRDFDFIGIYGSNDIKTILNYVNNKVTIDDVDDNTYINTIRAYLNNLDITRKNPNSQYHNNYENIIDDSFTDNTTAYQDETFYQDIICLVIKYLPCDSAINDFVIGPEIILETKDENGNYIPVDVLQEYNAYPTYSETRNNTVFPNKRKLFTDKNTKETYITYFYKITDFDELDGLRFSFANFNDLDESNEFAQRIIEGSNGTITEENFNEEYLRKTTIHSGNTLVWPYINKFETIHWASEVQNRYDYYGWITELPLYKYDLETQDVETKFNLSNFKFRIIPDRFAYSKNYDKLLSYTIFRDNNSYYKVDNSDTSQIAWYGSINIHENIQDSTVALDYTLINKNLNDVFNFPSEISEGELTPASLYKSNYSITPQINEGAYDIYIGNISDKSSYQSQGGYKLTPSISHLQNITIKPFTIKTIETGTNLFIVTFSNIADGWEYIPQKYIRDDYPNTIPAHNNSFYVRNSEDVLNHNYICLGENTSVRIITNNSIFNLDEVKSSGVSRCVLTEGKVSNNASNIGFKGGLIDFSIGENFIVDSSLVNESEYNNKPIFGIPVVGMNQSKTLQVQNTTYTYYRLADEILREDENGQQYVYNIINSFNYTSKFKYYIY